MHDYNGGSLAGAGPVPVRTPNGEKNVRIPNGENACTPKDNIQWKTR